MSLSEIKGDEIDLPELLRTTPLFSQLDQQSLTDLEDEVQIRYLSRGDILFHQGDDADDLFIVASGRLRIYLEATEERPSRILSEISCNEIVGELGVLTGEPRQATVCAVRDSYIVRLDSKHFHHFAARHYGAMREISKVIVDRLRQATHSPMWKETVRTVAVVPLSPSVHSSDFVANLTEAFSAHGEAICLNAQKVDDVLGAGMAQSQSGAYEGRKVITWLHEQEVNHLFVVYECEATPSQWTRRSVSQADLVLYLGMANQPPPSSEVERYIRSTNVGPGAVRCELVLLSANSGTPPNNTAAWREAFAVNGHHHVRLDNGEDVCRLARLLIGRGVALVLGGGGARGYAHVGAIKALEEAGIPIDTITSTSIGGVIGGLYAMGHDYRSIMEQLREKIADRKWLHDYTIPFFSLLKGVKNREIQTSLFRDVEIEDLWLDFACVAANLTRARQKIYRRGPLVRAVMASIAVPGMLPPVIDNGEVMVDGGIINNLPTLPARENRNVIVIAIDVSGPDEMTIENTPETHPVLWKMIRWFFHDNEEHPNIPNIGEVLMRSVTMGNAQSMDQVKAAADLYVNMPVQKYASLDWKHLDEMVEIGYRTMKAALEKWENKPK